MEKNTRRKEQTAKEKARKDAEEAHKAKVAQAKAKREAELAAKEKAKQDEQAAKEKARKDAEEAQKAKEAQAKIEAKLTEDTELYEGVVKLVIPLPVNIGQVKELVFCLRDEENIKVSMVGGSKDEGGTIWLSVENPIMLLDILRAMPPVEQVAKGKNMIIVKLRNSIAPTAN